jgi:hypothetical protein
MAPATPLGGVTALLRLQPAVRLSPATSRPILPVRMARAQSLRASAQTFGHGRLGPCRCALAGHDRMGRGAGFAQARYAAAPLRKKKERRGPLVPHRNKKIRRVLRGRVLVFGCGPHHPLVRLIFQLRRHPPALAGRQVFRRGARFALPRQKPRSNFRHQDRKRGTTTKDRRSCLFRS